MYHVVTVAKYNNKAEWESAQWNLEGPIISAFVPLKPTCSFSASG